MGQEAALSFFPAGIPLRNRRKCEEDKISVSAQKNGFCGGWLCGEDEKMACKLYKFLNKKHLIALKEGEGPSCVCIRDFSEHQ